MVKTLLTPKKANISISIPQKYVGKQIELFYYALDELTEEKSLIPKKTMADFWGTLSDATANDLQKQTQESRKTWDERLNNQL